MIDTPPGTGDIHISLLKHYRITGAVVVTTPQDVSICDVRKSIDMYKKMNAPVLGVIENMSYLIDYTTNKKQYIFGKGGGEKISDEYDIPLLIQIPLSQDIAKSNDSGKLFSYYQPDKEESLLFLRTAKMINTKCKK